MYEFETKIRSLILDLLNPFEISRSDHSRRITMIETQMQEKNHFIEDVERKIDYFSKRTGEIDVLTHRLSHQEQIIRETKT